MRWLLSLAFLLSLAGCDRVTVQHGPNGLVLGDGGEPREGGEPGDGGEPRDGGELGQDATVVVPGACADAQDGDPCDDLDVCTPTSRCEDGECVGMAGFDDCVLADALSEFQEEQGREGWYYGYWNESADADGGYDSDRDFSMMELCRYGQERLWQPPGRCGTTRDEPGYKWTRVGDFALMHPETRPDTELPIRRWVSDVSGPARVTLTHWVSGTTGDGTRALLLLDGRQLWRHDIEPGDRKGVEITLDVDLRVGSVLDQVLHPIGTSADDMTTYSMRVEGPSAADPP